MTDWQSRARAIGALMALAAFLAALLADMLIKTVTLSDRSLDIFLLLLSSLFGLDILRERWRQILEFVSFAIEGYLHGDARERRDED